MHLTFANLDPGDHFRFLYNVYTNPRIGNETFVKTNNHGWYRRVDDKHAYHTGSNTAVVLVADIPDAGDNAEGIPESPEESARRRFGR